MAESRATKKPELGTCRTASKPATHWIDNLKPHIKTQNCVGWQALPPSQEGACKLLSRPHRIVTAESAADLDKILNEPEPNVIVQSDGTCKPAPSPEELAREIVAECNADLGMGVSEADDPLIARVTALLRSRMERAEPTFWAIERFENGKSAGYWTGASSRDFTTDIDKAIQFRRRDDAFWITRGWHWADIKLTEHMYVQQS